MESEHVTAAVALAAKILDLELNGGDPALAITYEQMYDTLTSAMSAEDRARSSSLVMEMGLKAARRACGKP